MLKPPGKHLYRLLPEIRRTNPNGRLKTNAPRSPRAAAAQEEKVYMDATQDIESQPEQSGQKLANPELPIGYSSSPISETAVAISDETTVTDEIGAASLSSASVDTITGDTDISNVEFTTTSISTCLDSVGRGPDLETEGNDIIQSEILETVPDAKQQEPIEWFAIKTRLDFKA